MVLVQLTSLAFLCFAQSNLPLYEIESLGSLGPRAPDDSFAAALNHSGDVVGFYYATDLRGYQRPRAYRWESLNGMSDLSAGASLATSINDNGVIVGNRGALGSLKAYAWGDLERNLHIGTLAASSALDVNFAGAIVGEYDAVPASPVALRHPFAYLRADGAAHTGSLPPGVRARFSAVNDRGQIALFVSEAAGTGRAFRRDPGGAHLELEGLGGDFVLASAINRHGELAGYARDATGEIHAVKWDRHGVASILDALPGYSEPSVMVLSDEGVVLGSVQNSSGERLAVYWVGTRPKLLVSQLPTGSAWVLEKANGINALNEICGTGVFQGKRRAFRMCPIQSHSITPIVGGGAGSRGGNAVFGRAFTPGERVDLYCGFAVGVTPVAGCALQVGIDQAQLHSSAQVDSSGRVRFDVDLPPSLGGQVIYVQAVEVSTCILSAVQQSLQ